MNFNCRVWPLAFCVLTWRHILLAGALSGLSFRKVDRSANQKVAEPYRQTLRNVDGEGMAYTASMTIGGQKIEGILDTGSYELLVFSSSCHTCGGALLYYNGSQSRTRREKHLRAKHSFGSGSTWSQLAYEEVDVGPLTANNQYFWEVVDAALPSVSEMGFQAIVGLGPPSTPRSDSQAQAYEFEEMRKLLIAHPRMPRPPDAKEKLAESKELAEQATLLENFGVRSFSVCIERPANGKGVFIWNDDAAAVKAKHVGVFTKADVIGDVTWGVHMDKLQLTGGKDILRASIGCDGGCGVILDSGTSLITVPTHVAKNALDVLNQMPDCSDFSKLPDITFELGGQQFRLPPEAYIGEVYGELPPRLRKYANHHNMSQSLPSCQLLMMTMDVETQFGPLYILGMPFFREYYTNFDVGHDIWDRSARCVRMAAADVDCQPALHAPRTRRDVQRQGLRRVDLSTVRLPKWVEHAAEKGFLRM